jgi:hypothetical protein
MEAPMTKDDERLAHVVHIACELVRMGDFESIATIEREVLVEDFVEGAHWTERASIRNALDKISFAKRQTPEWHQHTAFVASLR